MKIENFQTVDLAGEKLFEWADNMINSRCGVPFK